MSPEFQTLTGVLSGVTAGVLLGAFVALCVWVSSARRQPRFDAAARLPLEEDPRSPDAGGGKGS